MAQYATVNWSDGDEVTSQKLNQMAQNEQWVKDNLIIGNANYVPNPQGKMVPGRSKGITSVTKMEIVEVVYDSQVPVKYWDLTVNFPPVFTEQPTVFYSHLDTDEDAVVRMTLQTGTKSAKFRVWNTDGLSKRKHGYLNLLLLGK